VVAVSLEEALIIINNYKTHTSSEKSSKHLGFPEKTIPNSITLKRMSTF
jgi:hypothetical protein